MTKYLSFLTACLLSFSAGAAPLVLDELPAKYCANPPTAGMWTDAPGHCRFALLGPKEEIAVVSVKGIEVRAKLSSIKRRPGKITKTYYRSWNSRIKMELTSTPSACRKAKNTGCAVSHTGTLVVWGPRGKVSLPLTRSDGA